MGEAIIPIVIFGIVFIRIILAAAQSSAKSKKKTADRKAEPTVVRTKMAKSAATPNKPGAGSLARPNKPQRGSRTATPNKPAKGERLAKPNKPVRGTNVSKPNVPNHQDEERTLEERLADYKKWKHSQDGSTQQSGRTSKQKPVEANAILDAARENTIEVELDNDLDAIETENLMERVYEVMVKGPDDSLQFQRDFVAEGMEMLNSFTLPD